MIGLLGGTFDPVHFGHLRIALEVYQDLGLEQVRLLPCARPAHREPPLASAEHRLQMLHLAVVDEPAFKLDDREYRRPGPSYMVDTLISLRDELGDASLCLILGSDAFEGLDSWHRWQQIIELTHIVIAHRPGWQTPLSHPVAASLSDRFVEQVEALRQAPAGKLLPWPVSQLDISATRIRQQISEGKSPRYLVPDSVWNYIQQHRLYNR